MSKALYDQTYTKEERFRYCLNWGHNRMKAKCAQGYGRDPDVEIVFRDRQLVEVKCPSLEHFSDYHGYWTMMGGIVEAIREIQQSWEAKK